MINYVTEGLSRILMKVATKLFFGTAKVIGVFVIISYIERQIKSAGNGDLNLAPEDIDKAKRYMYDLLRRVATTAQDFRSE